MKKIFLTERRIMGAILVPILVISLQSCCFQFEEGLASRKKCNCNKDLVLSGSSILKESNVINKDEQLVAPALNRTNRQMAVAASEGMVAQNNIPSENNGIEFKKMKAKNPPLGIKAMNTYLVAGPSLSFINGTDDDSESKAGVGFQAGIMTSYAFSNQFNVSTGLLIKKNTASQTLKTTGSGEPGGGDPGYEYKTKLALTYLSAPIMAEFKTGSGFTFMAGPELNLLLGANSKTSVNGNSEEKTDIKDEMVKTGIDIQAGVRYNFPRSPVMLQLVYDHRLSRLNKESGYVVPGGSGDDDHGPRTKSIQFSFGFSLCDLLAEWFQ